MFLFYCFHIFGFGFQILFFWIGYTFFWFWVLVKCKKWFIFCIWFWIFIYFILYWLYPLILFGLPLFIWHPPLVSPFYLVIKDQFIFICHPFAPAPAPAAAAHCFKSSSLVVVRRLFVPAKMC